MSCKVVRFKNFEIQGTSFESRTVTLNGDVITSAKIVVRTNLNKYLQEVPGVIEDNIIHFSLKPLEGLNAGNYIIEYWVEIENIGREVVAVEEFKVVRAIDSSCNHECFYFFGYFVLKKWIFCFGDYTIAEFYFGF